MKYIESPLLSHEYAEYINSKHAIFDHNLMVNAGTAVYWAFVGVVLWGAAIVEILRAY